MLLSRNAMAALLSLAIFLISNPLQARSFKGKVLDNKNQPVIGAVVMIQGNGVLTDANGAFEIDVPSAGGTAEISCLGYVTKKVTISPDQNNVTFFISEDALQLDGTVVVGYGTTKKINLTGAVSTVEADQLENRTANTLTHMLQGSVPGLTVTTSSGQPNEKPSLYISSTIPDDQQSWPGWMPSNMRFSNTSRFPFGSRQKYSGCVFPKRRWYMNPLDPWQAGARIVSNRSL